MKQVESKVLAREQVVYRQRVNPWSMAPQLIVGTVVTFAGMLAIYSHVAAATSIGAAFTPTTGILALVTLFGILLVASALIRYETTELALTNKRVVAKFGFIRPQTVELDLEHVERVEVEQDFLGRTFGFGTLVVAGAGLASAPIPGITSPLLFQAMVFETQDEEYVPLKLAA